MTVNLRALDEEINFLVAIRRFHSEPRYAHLLEKFAIASDTQPETRKRLAQHKGVKPAILSFLPDIADAPMTTREILRKMEEAKYKFGSKDPYGTVQQGLRDLEFQRLVVKAGTRKDNGAILWARAQA